MDLSSAVFYQHGALRQPAVSPTAVLPTAISSTDDLPTVNSLAQLILIIHEIVDWVR